MTRRSKAREERAADVWATIRELASCYPTPERMQDALGLGRGAGRVRALLSLVDGPRSISGLAEAASIDPPYATLVVDSLEERDLVARKADPTDRRRKLVELTPTGEEATRKLIRLQREPPPGLADLSDTDLDALQALIERVASTSAATLSP